MPRGVGKRVWTYYICPRQDTDGGKLEFNIFQAHYRRGYDGVAGKSITPVCGGTRPLGGAGNATSDRRGGPLRQIQVERARYEVTLAQRHYIQVDPSNRLVASCLEDNWN